MVWHSGGSARRVCKNWGAGVTQTLASRDSFSFAGWRVTDDAVATLVSDAWCLRELNLYESLPIPSSFRSPWSSSTLDSAFHFRVLAAEFSLVSTVLQSS